MKPILIKCLRYFLPVVCCFLVIETSAQDTTTRHKWQFYLEPYVMFPHMNGQTGVRELPEADVEADVGDIFSRLKIGAMLYLEAYKGNWAISSDVLYMNLEQDITSNRIINSGEVSMKQFGWELAGLYKVLPWLELGAGGRLNQLKADVKMNVKTLPPGTNGDRSGDLKQTWFDPIIITRLKLPTTGKLIAQLRADIGGFGVGSDLAWQIQADAGYHFSKLFRATLGYRIISMDYESGSGNDHFLYDMNTFGPVLRLGFKF